MTIDISNVVAISLGVIAVLISGRMAFNQWKLRMVTRAFKNGAVQAIRTVIGRAILGKEFEIVDEQTGQKIWLIRVNKKKDKKDKKKKNA